MCHRTGGLSRQITAKHHVVVDTVIFNRSLGKKKRFVSPQFKIISTFGSGASGGFS